MVEALASLDRRGMIGMTRVSGGRAIKYAHHAGEALRVDEEQLALLGILLLRRPQTAAQLRTRTERYVAFESVHDAEDRLNDLMRRDEPLIEHLEREPGQKERRDRCLLTEPIASADSQSSTASATDLEERVCRTRGGSAAGAAAAGRGLTFEALTCARPEDETYLTPQGRRSLRV